MKKKIGKLLLKKTANTGNMAHAVQHFLQNHTVHLPKKLHCSIFNSFVIAG